MLRLQCCCCAFAAASCVRDIQHLHTHAGRPAGVVLIRQDVTSMHTSC